MSRSKPPAEQGQRPAVEHLGGSDGRQHVGRQRVVDELDPGDVGDRLQPVRERLVAGGRGRQPVRVVRRRRRPISSRQAAAIRALAGCAGPAGRAPRSTHGRSASAAVDPAGAGPQLAGADPQPLVRRRWRP